MLKTEYIKSDGRIYEVVGKDGMGFPVCKLTTLKEIPEDKLETEEHKREREKAKESKKDVNSLIEKAKQLKKVK